MNDRAAARLAWGLFALFVALAVASLALVVFGLGAGGDPFFLSLTVGFALAGALVASRQPANTVGWLLLGIALSVTLGEFVDTYATRSANPGAAVAGWLSNWMWTLWVAGVLLFVPLVFPNGRLLSPRWRVVVWFDVVAVVLGIAGPALAPGPLDIEADAPIENPFEVRGALGEVISTVARLSDWLLAVGLLLSIVAVSQRLRRSRGRERAQIKWFAYVAVLALLAMGLAFASVLAGSSAPTWVEVLGAVGWGSALPLIFVGLPMALGIAILRHRLFDIDVVINRTLVYGFLTATLAASYLGSVLLLQVVLGPLTSENGLAIAGSTLAVAALFRPARSRIQSFVDRRFYRRHYDAARTLEEFTVRLRDELDLEALGADLRGVVRDTVQPAHVSLWLREAPR